MRLGLSGWSGATGSSYTWSPMAHGSGGQALTAVRQARERARSGVSLSATSIRPAAAAPPWCGSGTPGSRSRPGPGRSRPASGPRSSRGTSTIFSRSPRRLMAPARICFISSTSKAAIGPVVGGRPGCRRGSSTRPGRRPESTSSRATMPTKEIWENWACSSSSDQAQLGGHLGVGRASAGAGPRAWRRPSRSPGPWPGPTAAPSRCCAARR